MAESLLSMTGYGESQAELGGYTALVTVRSVNSRYLDFRFKAPVFCAYLEPRVRQLAKKLLLRGKVEVSLTIVRSPDSAEAPVRVDMALAHAYKNIFAQLQCELALAAQAVPLSLIVAQPDVIVRESVDARSVNAYTDSYLELIEQALRSLISMQEAEGQVLQEDLLMRCSRLESLINEISQLVQGLPDMIRDKLVVRMKALLEGLAPIDDVRVYQEAAQIADRADVTEELVRFQSHCQQFVTTICEQTGPRGKKLDFIIQELLRETNTIGSKASALPVLHVVVQVKDELEKLREQVQNIA